MHLQVGQNRFLATTETPTAELLDRAQLYEALVRTDNAFMLTLFASLEAEVTVRASCPRPRHPTLPPNPSPPHPAPTPAPNPNLAPLL